MDVVEANTGILPVDDWINRIQNLSSDKIVIQESGYLEVYVNNEAQTPVYYDNLMVMQSTGNVIEVNAYYPYGKIIQGLSTSSTYGKNNYKYNGKELQTDMELNWLDYGWRMLDGPRWFVPDPLAEKYYSTSPYVYVGNNPINAFDPDGMDHYLVTDSGRVILALKTDDNYDRLYSSYTDRYGSGNIYISGGYVDVKDRSILPDLSKKRDSKEYNGSYAVTTNQTDVFNVFVFAANNSDVEWSMSAFSMKDKTNYVISTSHNEGSVSPATSINGFDQFDMIFKIHTHPGGDEQKAASEGPLYPNDMDLIIDLAWKFYNKDINKYNTSFPKHYIYHPNSSSVIEYTASPRNRSIPRGTAKTGMGLQKIIRK